MIVSQDGIDLIKGFEGLELEAYQDEADVWTIGYGTTKYENGKPVKPGDKIPLFRAEQLITFYIKNMEPRLNALVGNLSLTQNQFDALASLAYNIGVRALAESTVYKRVLNNTYDPSIRNAFRMWNKVTKGKVKVVSDGLVARREKEADYYFLS